MVWFSLLLYGSPSARAQPIASTELMAWIEPCAVTESSFKWTDLGYPWLGVDWGYQSVDTARLGLLPEACDTATAQALRLLSDAVVVVERELAQGHGGVLATFYRYWQCSEAQASALMNAARREFPNALAQRPDPELNRADWLIWMWALLTESSPWRC